MTTVRIVHVLRHNRPARAPDGSDVPDWRPGLALRAASLGRSMPPQTASPDPREDPASHIAAATGTGAWTQYEITAQIPADASLIRFGVFLNGGGQLEIRHPVLALHQSAATALTITTGGFAASTTTIDAAQITPSTVNGSSRAVMPCSAMSADEFVAPPTPRPSSCISRRLSASA